MDILKISCPTGAATQISAAKKRSAAIIYTFSASTVYVAVNGLATVTGPSGAKPGLPLTAGQSIALHSPTAPGDTDKAFFVRNDSGAAVDVIVQEW